MPIRDNLSLKAIRQRFAQPASAQTPQASAKPIVREYVNPTDPEAIVLAAKKRDIRTRAQRPSTPPRLDSPMPSLTLDNENAGLADLDPSNSIYMSAGGNSRSPRLRSPLFFPLADQEQPLPSSFQQRGQEMSAGEADTLARNIPQPPLAQGSRVSVLRKLREMPTLTVLGMSDPATEATSDEIAATINAGSTEAPLIEGAYFVGAAVALRRRPLRPSALNLAAIATSKDPDDIPEPIAPRAPRKRFTFPFNAEISKDQEPGLDLETELNNNP